MTKQPLSTTLLKCRWKIYNFFKLGIMAAGNWKEMYQASLDGNLSLVQYHITEGVNPNYQHPEILATPLVAAILNNHDNVAIFLLENGADPNLESYFDNLTPLKAAKKMKNKHLIALIKNQLKMER